MLVRFTNCFVPTVEGDISEALYIESTPDSVKAIYASSYFDATIEKSLPATLINMGGNLQCVVKESVEEVVRVINEANGVKAQAEGGHNNNG